MSLNLNAKGRKIGPFRKAYTWRDVILYALGVGAGFSEIHYCYEKSLKVLPTFAATAIIDFLWAAGAASEAELTGILHGEQEIVFHNPIPTDGELTTEGAITDFWDKGADKGALIVARSETRHDRGHTLFTSIITLFARHDGGFDGPNTAAKREVFPETDPDFSVGDTPATDQPLLYRLSGDLFDLHVDADFARRAGFEKPIMHGLCTFGYACRALIAKTVPGSPEKVRRIKCRFARPLYPGIPIETRIWRISAGRCLWRTVNARTGERVIDQGVFETG